MKHFILSLLAAVSTLVLSSCSCGSPFSLCGKKLSSAGCSQCAQKQTFPSQGCEGQRFVEREVTEYVEEEITIQGKGAKAVPETVVVRRPVTRIVREPVPCGDCGSKFCATPDCCGITPISVLSRATAQGGTGEPHFGTIPTMKVLVTGARETSDL